MPIINRGYGSTSGGDSIIQSPKMQFWPLVLQQELPEAHVQSIAIGGATSWHMKHAFQQLNIKPDVCVFYMGHNDSMRQAPRQTLAQMENQEKPTSGEFVRWVTLPEASRGQE